MDTNEKETNSRAIFLGSVSFFEASEEKKKRKKKHADDANEHTKTNKQQL
jgi:hypothetical protein